MKRLVFHRFLYWAEIWTFRWEEHGKLRIKEKLQVAKLSDILPGNNFRWRVYCTISNPMDQPDKVIDREQHHKVL